ncbi:MAG: DNA gyrase inhibitor YacG [Pseudomonadota bacterium]|nr:DNA gyrase inhibitor YacG [Pseudomonadota bacterium]
MEAGVNDQPAPPPKPCAICGKPRDPQYAPFCSRRCADIDLGRWLKGSYVIPGAPVEQDDPADEE